MPKILVAPSLLSADFTHLAKDIALAVKSGADFLHYDIMDGHFVPNISFGPMVLKATAPLHNLVKDVHLMIEEPQKYVLNFIQAGADILTFHYEAFKSDEERLNLIKYIQSHKIKAGMSIRPGTPVEVLGPFLSFLDLILIMSVEPGFGGQAFLASSLEKLNFLKDKKVKNHYTYLIEVDGGINEETSKLVVSAGAEVLVAGSYLFGQDDFAKRLKKLKNE